MTGSPRPSSKAAAQGRDHPPGTAPPKTSTAGWLPVAAVVAVVVIAIVSLYAIFRSSSEGSQVGYQVGSPGIGQAAPSFDLASSTGGSISLADFRGQTVLLYFQEGLTCQPCWDQLTDLEKHQAAVRSAGIDSVVSITTDPVNLVARKARDMGLTTPILSDPTLAMSNAYNATDYGMMGDSRDGHTFILVGPDGTIQWRADYGGAPDYTMFVPTSQLLASLEAGRSS
jgi:peroxiredoxin